MAEYILSGRTPGGRRTTQRIDAESADQAVEIFRDDGFTEIVLHTDDVAALYTRQSATDEMISPREFIEFRDRGGFLHSTFFIIRKIYIKTWGLSAGAILTMSFRRTSGMPWGPADYLSLTALAFPLVYAPLSQLRNPARRYHHLQDALAWGRWEEALRLLPLVSKRLPPEDTAFNAAKALAALGRLDEACQIVAPFADDPLIPKWLFHGRMADVYFAAREIERAIGCLEEAAADAPTNPTVLLDLANALLRYRQDVDRAETLLANAKSHAISDILVPVVAMIEGIIAFERRNAHEAREKLRAAFQGLSAFRGGTPLLGIILDMIRTYLSLAHAELGDMEAAKAEFHIAAPRLRALRIDQLIRRCERAIH